MKHIKVDFHFIPDKTSKKEIEVRYISTKYQIVDFHKSLDKTIKCAFEVQVNHSTLTKI